MGAIRFVQRHPLYLPGASLLLMAFALLWLFPEMYRQYAYDTILAVNIVSGIFSVLLALSLAGLVIGLFFYARKRGLLSGVLLALVILVGVVVLLALIGPSLQQPLTPVSSLRLNDHVYQLAHARVWYSGGGSITYILYECDSPGWMCHVLYRDATRPLSFTGFDASQPPLNARLQVDAATSTLSVTIADETVFTHLAAS